jgi:hypothetical protein
VSFIISQAALWSARDPYMRHTRFRAYDYPPKSTICRHARRQPFRDGGKAGRPSWELNEEDHRIAGEQSPHRAVGLAEGYRA